MAGNGRLEGEGMLSLLFVILMFLIFGKLLLLAIKAAWGITKVLVTFVFFPVVLISLVLGGLLYIAFPVLIIVGIILLVIASS